MTNPILLFGPTRPEQEDAVAEHMANRPAGPSSDLPERLLDALVARAAAEQDYSAASIGMSLGAEGDAATEAEKSMLEAHEAYELAQQQAADVLEENLAVGDLPHGPLDILLAALVVAKARYTNIRNEELRLQTDGTSDSALLELAAEATFAAERAVRVMDDEIAIAARHAAYHYFAHGTEWAAAELAAEAEAALQRESDRVNSAGADS